jgi:GntR family transcriptional regulator
MQISITKNSDVPLRQQLAEQIVFLVTTGQLRAGEELPSVRALARQVKVHHNTVSEAYQELVRRGWLTRHQGSRLTVGKTAPERPSLGLGLDELINESILRATEMGYSLQALQDRVRERLLAQPPDHVLIVEDEPGLREIIRLEVLERLDWPVESSSRERFLKEPGLAVGAQVLAPKHIVGELNPLVAKDRPCVSIAFGKADEQVEQIRGLKEPSIVAVASVSESLLKTARSLFAAAIARKHTFKEFLLSPEEELELKGMDVVFCDSMTMPFVRSRNKILYQLLAPSCLEYLADSLKLKLRQDRSKKRVQRDL